MKKIILAVIGLAFMQTSASFAESKLVLEGKSGNITNAQEGINQDIAASATYNGTEKMDVSGAGIRIKSVTLLGDYYVYVAQLFVSDVKALRDAQAGGVNAMDKMKAAAIYMTFNMDLTNKKVVNAYKESLKDNNGFNLEDKDLADFINAAKKIGDVVKGDTLALIGLNSDELIIEAKGQEVARLKSTGLVKRIFAIWLGKTGSDEGLANLKKKLIGE